MGKTGIQAALATFGEGYGIHAKLAALLGVSRQAVQGWERQGYAPYGRARQIEHHTGVDRRRLVDPVIRDLFDFGG